MTTPIPALERAARALYAAVTVEMGEHTPDDWDDVGPDNELARAEWIRGVRAVLEAIREPDEAMVEAACAAHTPQWASVDRYIKLYARDMIRAALKAGIDALLHPTQEKAK